MNWKQFLLICIVVAFYILHQDFWNWRETAPIIFGFLPIGFFYHICYTIVVSLLMWSLVKYAWPSHLEEGAEEWESGGVGERESGLVNVEASLSHSPTLARSQQTEDSE